MKKQAHRIIWVDDEIDMLAAHISFLEQKGFSVTACSSGEDAIEAIKTSEYDLVLLDEMMPGMGGLETLESIKEIRSHLPVVMVTKSEEESLMEDALGKKIDDYLTKPVNPSQVLMVIKKHLQQNKIVTGQLGRRYIADINRMNMAIGSANKWSDWVDAYRLLCEWDLELSRYHDDALLDTQRGMRKDWDLQFARYYEKNYEKWVNSDPSKRPPLSCDILDRVVKPRLIDGQQVVFIVIDCMRLDLWMMLEDLLSDMYHFEHEYYFSIIPSATPFARNAIFSGLFPNEVSKLFPDDWKAYPDDEISRNRREGELIKGWVERNKINLKNGSQYLKILNARASQGLPKKIESFLSSQLVSLVVNFVDVLTHGRSSNVLLKEIVPDEAAFRGLMRTWFEHSTLYDTMRMLAKKDVTVVITSDHGSTLCQRGTIAHGKKDTSTNLRYKYGDNLNCNPKEAILIKNPDRYKLPTFTMGTTYIIAREDFYFVYPNKYNEYQRQFQNSFQHGGISMDEIILPVAILRPKR